MTQEVRSTRVARLGELDAVPVGHALFHPVRRALGVRAFGVNAFTAEHAGGWVIEPHDETGTGAGGHEELYVVVTGHAVFTVGDEEIDAAAGTLVFVPDLEAKRSAKAKAPQTTVLVVGGPADRPLPVSPFEYWYVAEGPYRDGDFARAVEIASAGFAEWPDHPTIHFQVACYHARAGDTDAALDHLARACAGDPRARKWAATDPDFDGVRGDPRFKEAIAG